MILKLEPAKSLLITTAYKTVTLYYLKVKLGYKLGLCFRIQPIFFITCILTCIYRYKGNEFAMLCIWIISVQLICFVLILTDPISCSYSVFKETSHFLGRICSSEPSSFNISKLISFFITIPY